MTKLTYVEEIEAIIRDARAQRSRVVSMLFHTAIVGAWSSSGDIAGMKDK
jgi:hypothetical protein